MKNRSGKPYKPVPEPFENTDGTWSVPLVGRKLFATVDTEDVPKIRGVRWYLHPSGYAYRPRQLMHKLILPVNRVDHVNGNSLDNRRLNLRSCSHTENMWNRKKGLGRSSKFKGVHRLGKRWIAAIRCEGVRTYLGSFAEEIDAAAAYDRECAKVHGSFARLNLV